MISQTRLVRKWCQTRSAWSIGVNCVFNPDKRGSRELAVEERRFAGNNAKRFATTNLGATRKLPTSNFWGTCTNDAGSSFCVRNFTSVRTTDQGFGANFASRINKSIKEYPIETVGTIMSLEMGTIFGTYGGLVYLSVDFPAEFAFAFAISRLVRRVRLPVEIVVAKGMKTMAPVLATVRILDLFSKLTPGKEKTSTCESETRDQSKMSFLEKGSNYVYDTVNQYGLCYFLSSRLVGVVVVFGIYESILLGVDMSPLIEYFGAEKVGDVLGTWAGAVVISSTLYPVTIFATSHIAPYIGQKREEISSTAND